ncbi:glycoside hydrolase family 2 TIM barrel-domain containing protein [Planctomyces sp. SH-PL14]|uniref:glycoside hydrolase family 2 TIM barrel-domain containing protein n=1 Tax=Planctomyces sp. SH-PL14 TaxID=1632864 RepID=UPI00078BAE7C|nr:glycoside hydrolase family 2 TIM barrel-domain containing protein [Planctomyces sp. SH-PL14]AMV22358.1 beta-D-glucuronidase [Planctomyces sp. SH-PL14]
MLRFALASLALLVASPFLAPQSLHAQAIRTSLVQRDGRWQLMRDGQPYFIKGGGGGGSKLVLRECDGNSFRTWGVGAETAAELDEARKLGLTVSVGIWLGHKEHGFDYTNAQAVAKQLEDARQAVRTYKDHPAVLVWGIGNEMEVNNEGPEVWRAIQEIARAVHEIDPNHPTMTVIAELGKDKVQQIHELCPDIDIIGVNTYGGGPSLAKRYREARGTKPYIITEFGPPGTWEIPLNAFGAPSEQTSTAKAKSYREIYEKSVTGAPELCLGSYAFTWGHKIEATATWFGMFLPDGDRLAAVDTMQELWSGKAPQHPVPAMESLKLAGPDQVKAGETVEAEVKVGSGAGDVKIHWALYSEQGNYGVTGTGAEATPQYPDAIRENGGKTVRVKTPMSGGIYRLYCYLHNDHGGAAVGSLPIQVKGPKTLIKAPAAKLPFAVLSDDAKGPYIPSGWMGDAGSISMDEGSTTTPHSGKTCLKVSYEKKGGWGSVVWQHPANDWGEQPGGFDVTGAEALTFWARGESGGEKVVFGYGLLGIERKYHDSSKGEIEVTLTPEWKQYTIDLGEKELTRIKSGFLWRIGTPDGPMTFYVDDIEYR